MDLSNINKGLEQWNQKNRGSKHNKSKTTTCYSCGKPGHFANREPMLEESEITYEVLSVLLRMRNHEEELDLVAFRIATHNIVLGLL